MGNAIAGQAKEFFNHRITKYILLFGSSTILSKALTELMLRYSILSINIILQSSLNDDLFEKLIISRTFEISIFTLPSSLEIKKKLG